MKIGFNMTSCEMDLARFSDRAALERQLAGFDGLELLYCDEDTRGLITPDMVTGLHMCFYPYWLDFWRGDHVACLKEFGSYGNMTAYYGGEDIGALIGRFRRDLDSAARYGAEYVVFHISDAGIEESFTGRYRHSDEEVVDASCELLNELFKGRADGPLLLLENLWQPGLTLTRPEIVRRLLAGIEYPHTGLMLDTGHLMHTELSLRTQGEGLRYIHRVLDRLGSLCDRIRGVHLNQSLTGDYVRRVQAAPPPLSPDYDARAMQMLTHAFQIDLHEPFTAAGVDGLIARIAPDYLTFEFISDSSAKQRAMLDAQWRALFGPRGA